MIHELQKRLDDNHLSSLVVYERQLFGKSSIKPEHYYAAYLFIKESKLHDYEYFKQQTTLSKGLNFKSEYTKMIKFIIVDKYEARK